MRNSWRPIKSLKRRPHRGESSFTLFETVVALGIMTTVLFEVGQVQGNAIAFADYGRNLTQAIWLAKAKMSQVEYYVRTSEWDDVKNMSTKGEFDDYEGFQWELELSEWNLKLESLLNLSSGEEGEEEGGESDPTAGMASGMLSQALGTDALFAEATVTVSWAEGAVRNDTTLHYIFTNNEKVNSLLAGLIGNVPEFSGSGSGTGQPGGAPGTGQPGGAPGGGAPGMGQPGGAPGGGDPGTPDETGGPGGGPPTDGPGR